MSTTVGCNRHRIPPTPNKWVTNADGFLSDDAADRINRELQDYQARTGHHVLVYVHGEKLEVPKEEFCLVAFNAWGIGRRGHNDGVVLFVFPKEPRINLRIQVGFGLEAALTDREAVRILREIGPVMEAGGKDGGVESGVRSIIAEVDGYDRRNQ